MRHSLIVNAIISYGRCFASAEGRGVKLDGKAPWVAKGTEGAQWHKLLIDMRNQLTAHAGVSPFRKVSSVILVDALPQVRKVTGITCLKFEFVGFENGDIEKLLLHFDSVAVQVAKKIDLLSQKLIDTASADLIQNR